MSTRFFTVTVEPNILASKQALAAHADGDVLFDWTAFDVPKGACNLINASFITRSSDGSPQSHAINLYFAKYDGKGTPSSIGTIHATADGVGYYDNVIAATVIEENDQVTGLDNIQIAMQHFNRMGNSSIILQGYPDSGTNVGYDKLFVAAISADGTPSLASTIQCDGIQATSQNVLTVKTTDCRKVFAVGAIICY